jgi:hypothetical protein
MKKEKKIQHLFLDGSRVKERIILVVCVSSQSVWNLGLPELIFNFSGSRHFKSSQLSTLLNFFSSKSELKLQTNVPSRHQARQQQLRCRTFVACEICSEIKTKAVARRRPVPAAVSSSMAVRTCKYPTLGCGAQLADLHAQLASSFNRPPTATGFYAPPLPDEAAGAAAEAP